MGRKTRVVEEVEELQRIWAFSLYITFGENPHRAAERAGYEVNKLSDEYVNQLVERAHEEGHVRRAEIPFDQMIASQEQPSLAVIVHFRDHAEKEAVRVDCAKYILALNGRTPDAAKPKDPLADLFKLMAGWTESERARYLSKGEMPKPRQQVPAIGTGITRVESEVEIEEDAPIGEQDEGLLA